jgi:Flp pilus assembly pilin Flp
MNLRDCSSVFRAAVPREEGQTMAEYTLLLALITLGLIASFSTFGAGCLRLFEAAAKAIAP